MNWLVLYEKVVGILETNSQFHDNQPIPIDNIKHGFDSESKVWDHVSLYIFILFYIYEIILMKFPNQQNVK